MTVSHGAGCGGILAMCTLSVVSQPDAAQAAFLQTYQYVECRRLGHSWPPDGGFAAERVAGRPVLEQRLPCTRGCGVVRIDRWEPVIKGGRVTGVAFDSRTYDYPSDDSYRADPGLDLTRTVVAEFEISRQVAQLAITSKHWRTEGED